MNHKMMMMRKRLACCSRDRELSIDFDDKEKVMTYNGLESYILDSHPYNDENLTSAVDGCLTDSYDDDSSCSSSNNVSASFSSNCTTKRGDDGTDEWESPLKPRHFYVKEKPSHTTELEDLETMKERFSKLLLGDDITGGSKGTSTALALSNAISNLAASVFGELWKLEPLPEERKKRWRREMDWFLSPTIYMIELVPARQNGSNGHIVEIMTPKARSDIHMNLPALRKLDSMLIETLDSMTNTEFWYAEVGSSRAEGRSKSAGQSRRWWLPSPRVPIDGLSDTERQKILNQGRIVSQIFKAAKSINENVLLEMPVPDFVRDALPKSGKESLGEELYKILTAETATAGDTINMLNLKSENKALEASNKLEAAIFTWKEIIAEQADGGSPVRKSWSFLKDPITEMDRTEYLLNRSEVLLQQLKSKYPNLPQTFLDAMKVQYGKDVGHSIIEAYSRVVGNLAFSILSRIGDILQEDIISNPNSPIAVCTNPWISESPMLDRIRLSLIDKINKVDGNSSSRKDDSDMKSQSMERRLCSMNAMPNHSQGFL